MTHTRLWSLTALACALLVAPSIPWMSIRRVYLGELHLRELRVPPLHLPSPDLGLISSSWILAATAMLLVGLTLIAVRRRRTPLHLAVVLARRGRPVAAIARRTHLSQDAIRDLLGGDPLAASTTRQGRFFRRRPKAKATEGASFADELSERSLDAKA